MAFANTSSPVMTLVEGIYALKRKSILSKQRYARINNVSIEFTSPLM